MTIAIQTNQFSGIKTIIPSVHDDDRGFFSELYNTKYLKEFNIQFESKQENHSVSYKKNTLRGLHAQVPPFAQAKLVRCGNGSFLDVYVDIRKQSNTFLQWGCELLSSENRKQLLIPEGFLHGFLTYEDTTEIIYKCSNFYSPEHEISINFQDADFNIEWRLSDADHLSISQKDLDAMAFVDFKNPF